MVKAFGREEEEVRRFQKGNSRMRRAELDLVDFDNRYYALFVTVEQLAQMAVWIIGSIMLLGSGEITYGVLVSFVGYVLCGFIQSAWVVLPICLVLLFGAILVIRALQKKKAAA